MMDDNDREIFRKESLDYISSPKQLDSYLTVTRPFWYVILIALVIALVCFLLWARSGTIPETLEMKAKVTGAYTMDCYISADYTAVNDLVGKTVNIPSMQGVDGIVAAVSSVPYSRSELQDKLKDDWLVENLVTDSYMYEVNIRTTQKMTARSDALSSVSIAVAEIPLVSFLFK